MLDRCTTTFYGACHVLMARLIEKYPTATIVFMIPMHRVNEYIDGREPFRRYVVVIREVAEFYSIPVLDLYANGGIQPQIKVQFSVLMKDGVHPNDAGFERTADRPRAFLLEV